jgi:hypothetical protein
MSLISGLHRFGRVRNRTVSKIIERSSGKYRQ